MMYPFNMDNLILIGSSVAFGVLIGLTVRRPLPFIILIFIVPIAFVGGIYLADLIRMQYRLGHVYSESWAGLVIPVLSIFIFEYLAPTAICVAGLKWILLRNMQRP